MVQEAPPKDELTELIEFLNDVRSNIRKMAAEIVKGLTGSPQGLETLLPKARSLLPSLFRLLHDPHHEISKVSGYCGRAVLKKVAKTTLSSTTSQILAVAASCCRMGAAAS